MTKQYLVKFSYRRIDVEDNISVMDETVYCGNLEEFNYEINCGYPCKDVFIDGIEELNQESMSNTSATKILEDRIQKLEQKVAQLERDASQQQRAWRIGDTPTPWPNTNPNVQPFHVQTEQFYDQLARTDFSGIFGGTTKSTGPT